MKSERVYLEQMIDAADQIHPGRRIIRRGIESMTREEQNIQTAQAGYAAFLCGDIPAILALCDERVEWIMPGAGAIPTAGIKKGHSGVLDFFGAVAATWQFEVFEPREYVASGDRVVVLGHYRARSRKTGRVVGSDWAMAWRFRDGKCLRLQEFTDTAVLAAALDESAASAGR